MRRCKAKSGEIVGGDPAEPTENHDVAMVSSRASGYEDQTFVAVFNPATSKLDEVHVKRLPSSSLPAALSNLLRLSVVPLALWLSGGDEETTTTEPDDSVCGNGEVESGEGCDDGNKDSGDGCSATCDEETGECGDGTVDDGEACDDGNTDSGDGCSETCEDETAAECGDGTVDPGEECDDSNTDSGDGCSSTCQEENIPADCGNGLPEGDEECDDGNAVMFDGCEVDCTVSPSEVECEVLTPLAAGVCEVVAGDNAKVIKGDVLGLYTIFRGGAVVVDAAGTIACAGCNCEEPAGATTITCPDAVVSPGLINTHEHITFAQNNPYNDTGERYEHRHDWRTGANGHTEINAQGSASMAEVRWGELRFLMSGATSLVGSGAATGFLRNLDRDQQEGLTEEPVHYETFPLGDSSGTQLTMGCNYPGIDTMGSIAMDDAYTPHVAEGISTSANNEFVCVSGQKASGEDLLEDQSAFIHSVGLTPNNYGQMAAAGTSLIWSPRSNVTLYGDTAVVTAADRVGVNIALGTDWVVTGSMNMFRELTCADELNSIYYDNYFTDRQLWQMVTINAARAIAFDDVLGSLQEGLVADIAIYDASTNADYRAILDGGPGDVALVLRGGDAIFGDAAVVTALAGGGCDEIDVCGNNKHLCTQADIGQSYVQLQAAQDPGFYPSFFCTTPTNEPSCVPERPAAVNNSTIYTGIPSGTDNDGDGVGNSVDNCPDVFNPVRPMDNGAQADFDGDDDGDACDVCPLNANTTTCTSLAPGDSDGDGIPNAQDNCPSTANMNQADADGDMKGDACDDCAAPNPGNTACPTTIYAIKDGTVMGDVSLSNVLVTGCAPTRGFFVQHKMGDADFVAPEHSGLFVYAPAVDCAMITAGTRVNLPGGTISDFFGQIQLVNATVNAVSSGEAAPAPVVLTVAEASTNSEYESVLARVENVGVTDNMPMAGPGDSMPLNEFVVGGSLRVNDLLFLVSPFPSVGTQYTSITGILDFRNGNQKLEPRSAADLAAGAPVFFGFSEPSSFSRVGNMGVSTFPTALEVVLTAPAQGNTFVTVASGNAAALSIVGGGATVLDGDSSATVLVNGLTQNASVTLTGTLGANMDTASVRVLGAAEQPSMLTFTPASAVLAPNGMTTFDLAFDIPAPPGGATISLSANPAGSGMFPATLNIPANQISGSFSYVDLNVNVSAVLTATFGVAMDTANITVSMGSGGLVINEVDYDQVGSDTSEFVELYNPTAGPISLTGYTLRLVHGSNSTHYGSVDLAPGGSVPAGGYVLIGSTSLLGMISNGAIEVAFAGAQDQIQNGMPDAVGLFNGTTAVDVLSYEGSITAGMVTGAGTVNFVEGTATAAADSNTAQGSLARDSMGTDTNDAATDWALAATPTPGSANP